MQNSRCQVDTAGTGVSMSTSGRPQWNPVDWTRATGQEFLNPNPSSTANFCMTSANFWVLNLWFRVLCFFFLLLLEEKLLPSIPSKKGNAAYCTFRLRKPDVKIITMPFSRPQPLNKHNTLVPLASSSCSFRIGRCSSPMSFPPVRRR